MCCYLFKHEFTHGSAGEGFTKTGFRAWNKALERLRLHVGEANSVHHKCFNKMRDLSNHYQSIQVAFDKQSEKSKRESQMRLEASIDVAKLLLHYGLPLFHTLQHQMDVVGDDSDKSIIVPSLNYVRDAKPKAAPPADMKEYPNSYVFIVDVPGLKSGDIKVQVEDDNVLLISGERKREEEKEGVKYIRKERMIGKFMRKFALREYANADAISAVCQDGVLTVTVDRLPTPWTKKRKTIEVNTA
ncbi:17.3 kDa class II heat shock protein-like [Lycium barbarum]|uniref:17.3 kDa class II heat shock protein-like n=1 Tax=Lycium barbarum TaxID=112863 RepID=UPI00293E54F3|nr:17.3 kDa class II heat shock protein-like [Lycium barbarum]